MKRKLDDKLDQALGSLKEAAGRGLDAPSLELEGRLQQLSGRLKEQGRALGHETKEELAQLGNQLLDRLEQHHQERSSKETDGDVQK